MASEFLGAPEYDTNQLNWLRKLSRVVAGIMQGKTNNTGSVTLAANASTTTVTLPPNKLGSETLVLFMPTTANAATEFGAGTLYVSARNVANNTFTITHVNNAQTDRTFNYAFVG